MLTRCPHCQTAFRVTHEQLIPRQGRVRCGACYQIFSALDSLSDEPVGVALPMADVLPMQAEAAPVEAVVAEKQAAITEASPAVPDPEPKPAPNPWPFPKPAPVENIEPVKRPESAASEPAEPAPEPAPTPEPSLAPEPEAAASPPEHFDEPEDVPPPRRWPWAFGIILLLLLGVIQLIYLFRVELAVLMPDLRGSLTASCEMLGCDVPYPRRPELMAIESSDLAPADKERLHLTANLRNRAPFAQACPHLELTLTDADDAPMLRKVLTPADYLPAGQSTAFLAPRDEVAVSLHFDTPGLAPVGYRLYLFYP